jgi:NADH-quinone oxidoreductase subunit N
MYDNIIKENFLCVELPIIMLISIEGMYLLICSNDLIIMYLALELQSIALYIMCSINRYSNLSIEAGLKYFILGSFSSAILLYGISLIYGIIGVTNYFDISLVLYSENINTNYNSIYYGLCCILVGILFKLALFPFHF